MKLRWRKKAARLVSNIFNPFLISLAVIVLLSFTSASSISTSIKWLSISISLSILPIFIVVVYLVHNHKIEGIFIRARKQRNRIYLLASVCTAVNCAVLYYLGAPRVLTASFVAGLLAIVIFMCINLWWKISVHTAFVTASVTVLIILYGTLGLLSAVLLPVMAWSRIELGRHSPAQVAVGAVLAALIVVVVFRFFGIIGPVSL
jgi:membrane-associated phospholipid phosphatase